MFCPTCDPSESLIQIETFCQQSSLQKTNSLLQNNNPPKLAEHEICSQIVAEGNVHSLDLRQRILDTEKLLFQLRELKRATDLIIADYKRVVHPIRRLPPEILAEIFNFHVSSLQPDSSLNPREGPWLLSQICSQWRRVALSLPRLWSRIILHLQEQSKDPSEMAITQRSLSFYLGLQLERTASYPLSVSFYSKAVITNDHYILPILLPSSPRWRELFLRIRVESYPALSQIEGFLQSLRRLNIRGAELQAHLPHVQEIITIFRFAPKLRIVEASTKTVLRLELPWSQVVTYYNPTQTQTKASRTKNNLEVLRRFPALERCLLSCRGDSEPQNPLIMPRLRHLYIRGKDSKSGVSLTLEHLTLPQIVSLHVEGSFDSSCILKLLGRNNKPTLTELGLHSTCLGHQECLQIVQGVPLLEKLVLTCDKVRVAEFLDELVKDSSIAPNLTRLIFRNRACGSDFDLAELSAARPTVDIEIETLEEQMDSSWIGSP